MSNFLKIILSGLCLLLFTFSAFAKGPTEFSFNKPSAIPTTRTLVNIGNWAYWMYQNGQSGITPAGNSGGIYPRGTAGAIFEDGVIWGGFLIDPATNDLIDNQPLRVGGQTYRQGTQPGTILSVGGGPDDPENNRIYRIRADWPTLTHGQVAQEAAEALQIALNQVSSADTDDLIEQYRIDWNEWPTDKGAPFVDVDGDGEYNPIIVDGNVSFDGDHPGIANADQVVYTVVNDLNSALTTDLYGSLPIGLELQITAWAYNQPGAGLGQLIFKKYKLINKSPYIIDSMYVSQWCDPDVGDFSNDVVGNDTTLSLGFAYNGPARDNNFDDFNLAPSALGYDFFQGPLVPGVAGQDRNRNGEDDATETGIFDLERTPEGYINLPMTSFGFFAAGSPFGSDPELGEYKGTREWYNLLRGFATITDDIENPVPFRFGSGPNEGQITKFPLSGDPVNDPEGVMGDVDGKGNNQAPSDRRMALSTGPFDLPIWDDANGNGVPDFGDAGVQEIVVAVVGGNSGPTGTANRSVAVMKETDQIAQDLYDDLFASVPKAPPAPKVNAVPYENSVLLEWGSDTSAVKATEADNPVTGYDFQGYNVYQMPNPNASKDESELIATFDVVDGVTTIEAKRFDPDLGQNVIVPVQFGEDNGVQRHITITQDVINSAPLFPGNTYYFAVTAYNFNPAPPLIEDKALESGLTAIPIIPQGEVPGERFPAITGDEVNVAHVTGGSDGQVQVKVINPDSLTGDEYEVFFEEFQFLSISEMDSVRIDSTETRIIINTTTGDTDTVVVVIDSTIVTWQDSLMQTAMGWNVRTTTGDIKVRNQFQASSIDARGDQPIFDGIQVKVAGPPPDFKSFEVVANADGPLDPPDPGAFAFQGFPTPDDGNPTDRQQATNDGHWAFHTGADAATSEGGDRGPYSAFLSRSLRGDNFDRVVPFDWEMRFTSRGSWAVRAFTDGWLVKVPFELWNVGINTPDDPSDDYRLIPWFLELSAVGMNEAGNGFVYQLGPNDHPGSSADNDPYTPWIYWRIPVDNSAGEAGYNAFVSAIDTTDTTGWGTYDFASPEAIARSVLVSWNGDDVSDGTLDTDVLVPEQGTVFRLVTTKPNRAEDVFAFTAPQAPGFSADVAKRDVEKINVFPNPYYATNPEEVGRFEKFVTFNHLPVNQEVTIRIFNLAGAQVRKLEKHEDPAADPTQFMRWDLKNEAGLPVASGMYIAYIEMPDIDATKVVKVFIVQHEEILRFF